MAAALAAWRSCTEAQTPVRVSVAVTFREPDGSPMLQLDLHRQVQREAVDGGPPSCTDFIISREHSPAQ